jgi:trigger factor
MTENNLLNYHSMQISRDTIDETTTKLTIAADQANLDQIKQLVLNNLGRDVKVAGFRAGKAPLNLLEKQLDPSTLQSEFMEQAVNRLYIEAIQQEKLRPVAAPQISITKFVPFTTLEFTAEVEHIGAIELPDYKKLKVERPKASVTAKDVDKVITDLRKRAAEKQPVKRAAQAGDQVTIDFAGVDAKTKEPIDGGKGEDYPLTIGSDTFIPGFEDNLIGLKAGGEKSFPLTFPKDYGAVPLQGKKVIFTVTVKSVDELTEPKLDDAFAATAGPFKTVAELKADIKKQLQVEHEREAENEYDNLLLETMANQTTVAIPKSLVEEEIDRIEEEEKRNLVYRGQTWQEHLDQEGVTQEQHRDKNQAGAELRVKAGLVLAEVSERENIIVSRDELEARLLVLRNQYTDPAMQAELDTPEGRRDINGRLLSEKTLDRLKALQKA